MKQTIYIPVKAEEELPTIDPQYNDYFTRFSIDVTALWDGNMWVRSWYDFGAKEWDHCEDWSSEIKSPESWLKPVEMPTEDQIIHFMRIGLEYLEDADGSGRFFGEREVAKAIIALMKG